jgi:hypothetical protein
MGRKYLGGLLAILLCSNAAAADWAVGINTVSWHSQPGYETFTPGVYVRGDGPVFGEVGVLRNSYGFTTVHAAIGYSYKLGDWDLSIAAGASYGYRVRNEWTNPDGSVAYYTYEPPKILPMLMPSIGYRITPEWVVRVFTIPALKSRTDAYCLSLAIERLF